MKRNNIETNLPKEVVILEGTQAWDFIHRCYVFKVLFTHFAPTGSARIENWSTGHSTRMRMDDAAGALKTKIFYRNFKWTAFRKICFKAFLYAKITTRIHIYFCLSFQYQILTLRRLGRRRVIANLYYPGFLIFFPNRSRNYSLKSLINIYEFPCKCAHLQKYPQGRTEWNG